MELLCRLRVCGHDEVTLVRGVGHGHNGNSASGICHPTNRTAVAAIETNPVLITKYGNVSTTMSFHVFTTFAFSASPRMIATGIVLQRKNARAEAASTSDFAGRLPSNAARWTTKWAIPIAFTIRAMLNTI